MISQSLWFGARCRRFEFCRLVMVLMAGIGAPAAPAAAQTEQSPPSRPLLDQLNREVQGLYRDAQQGLVRVQLPPPRWMNDYALAPINKWSKIDPDVRQKLEQARQQAIYSQNNRAYNNSANSAPAPSSDSTTTRPSNADPGTIIIVRPPLENQGAQQEYQQRDAVIRGRLQMDVKSAPDFAPNNLGLLLDEQGHVLVPLYVERETCAEQPLRCGGPGGQIFGAKFVGSDRQTNLTVLQLIAPRGAPIHFGARHPEAGAVVLYLSPSDGAGRLGLWTGGTQDYGVVVTTDGAVAGIARYGQFLSGSACRLIAEQIIHYGSVKRASLGVIISEVPADDALRGHLAALGHRTAMRIDEVVSGSAADRAGLKAGDILLALAGESVSDIPSLAAAIASRTGQTELEVLRGHQVIAITVDLQQK